VWEDYSADASAHHGHAEKAVPKTASEVFYNLSVVFEGCRPKQQLMAGTL
jgi:hypothetical protein